MTAQAALALLDLTVKAARAYERPDLAERLERGRGRLTDPAFHVLVVGEFKHGKSSLINSLLRERLCPVDDDIATAVPMLIGYAEAPTAQVAYQAAGGEDPDPEPISVDEVARFVTEAGNPENSRRIQQVQVGLPHPLLRTGLVLVDTPGVGGLGSAHSTITVGALPMASAVLFVSDASQELTGPELEFLETARSMCPNVLGVMTKTDFYPEWRRILDLDRGHLTRAGIDMSIVPVSATLRDVAIELDSGPLHQESGFPQLIDRLQRDVLADAEGLSVRAAIGDMLSVAGQLESQFAGEHAALVDPERAQEVIRQLEAARDEADRLRGQAAKWQQTLNDGFTDLAADAEHDLRARLRHLTRHADEAIDDLDPADAWDEFEAWLYRQAAEHVVANYRRLHTGAREIAVRVADHFSADGAPIVVNLAVEYPSQVMVEVADVADVGTERRGAVGTGLSAIRGSYSGMVMFGALGHMIGLGVLNPASVVVGLLLGRKTFRDEKNRALAQRRQQAKNAHRKYTDELAFEVTKDARDTLRRLQRQLRDHFAARADELHRSTAAALAQAQESATSEGSSREARRRDVEAELGRVRGLRDRIAALAPDLAATGTAARARS
jgi:hypothetical protein